MSFDDVIKNPVEDPGEIIQGLLYLARNQNLSDANGIGNAKLMVGAVRLINSLLAHSPA